MLNIHGVMKGTRSSKYWLLYFPNQAYVPHHIFRGNLEEILGNGKNWESQESNDFQSLINSWLLTLVTIGNR